MESKVEEAQSEGGSLKGWSVVSWLTIGGFNIVGVGKTNTWDCLDI